jgi:pimeloyl-ACP methyl ester carboxylesterase
LDTDNTQGLNALNAATSYNPNVNRDTVSVISPYFASGSDKVFAYPFDPAAKASQRSNTSALVWSGSQWSAGGNNQYPHAAKGDVSAFYILDEIIRHFDDQSVYPNMKSIVLVGHSMGGQMLARYAAIGDKKDTASRLVYWIGNPSSYTWLNEYRPMYVPDCPSYDTYREGFADFEDYPMTYGADLVAKGRDAILENFQSHQIAWGRALQDMGDHSSACGANTTGADNCDTVDLIDTTHDNGRMFNSPAGQSRIFHDNFDGNHDIAFDYGYPRAQDGDNPHPDTGAVDASGPYLNTVPQEWVYGGNMTYSGCWSDDQSAALEHQQFSDATVSVDGCTESCAGAGWAIAGMKEGNQCWCGNALGGFSSRVVDMSCHLPCSGNDGQTCGGPNRMSTYSVGNANIAKRDSAAAPMRFAETSERLVAMAEKNWRPRTEDLTKDSPAPEEGVSQEDAVNDVTPSDELSDEEQQLEDGSSGEQLLTSSGNSTDATEAPSWAADAAAAAASWQAEHPETTSTASA